MKVTCQMERLRASSGVYPKSSSPRSALSVSGPVSERPIDTLDGRRIGSSIAITNIDLRA